MSETYNDDDVLYHYKAPVTNEHVNQNPVKLDNGHSRFGRVYKPNPKYSEYGVWIPLDYWMSNCISCLVKKLN